MTCIVEKLYSRTELTCLINIIILRDKLLLFIFKLQCNLSFVKRITNSVYLTHRELRHFNLIFCECTDILQQWQIYIILQLLIIKYRYVGIPINRKFALNLNLKLELRFSVNTPYGLIRGYHVYL